MKVGILAGGLGTRLSEETVVRPKPMAEIGGLPILWHVWGYREDDPLGGHDPYSASKAACEILVAAYRRSFFPPERLAEHGVRLATARAGNGVGGGEPVTIADLVRLTADLAAGCEVRILGRATAGRPAERYVPDTTRARAELGLRPWIGLRDALARTLAAARAGPA